MKRQQLLLPPPEAPEPRLGDEQVGRGALCPRPGWGPRPESILSLRFLTREPVGVSSPALRSAPASDAPDCTGGPCPLQAVLRPRRGVGVAVVPAPAPSARGRDSRSDRPPASASLPPDLLRHTCAHRGARPAQLTWSPAAHLLLSWSCSARFRPVFTPGPQHTQPFTEARGNHGVPLCSQSLPLLLLKSRRDGRKNQSIRMTIPAPKMRTPGAAVMWS